MFQTQVCVGLIELVGYWWIRDNRPQLQAERTCERVDPYPPCNDREYYATSDVVLVFFRTVGIQRESLLSKPAALRWFDAAHNVSE